MKKINLITAIMALAIMSVNVSAQLKVDDNGKVGIRATPSSSFDLRVGGDVLIEPNGTYYSFYFDEYSGECRLATTEDYYGYIGSSSDRLWEIHTVKLYVNGVQVTSDKRKKKNIAPLNSGLDKVLKMEAKSYKLKVDSTLQSKDQSKYDKLKKAGNNQVGFLAQDLEGVIPEVVEYDEENDDYYINYLQIIPYLTEAIKEQQAQIESLQAQLVSFNNDVSNCCDKNKIKKKSTGALDAASTSTELYDNMPNPFTESTEIRYSLGNDITEASLYIYDLQGKQVTSMELATGSTSVTIEGSELEAGMYLYTLVANGEVIDTKRMILTK